MKRHEAENEAAEVRSWVCESCPTMTEPGERWCLHCKLYWQDVDNLMFDWDSHKDEDWPAASSASVRGARR